MAEINPTILMQQNEMLREIRDELKLGRLSSAGVPGSAGSPAGMQATPGSTYVQAQLAMDKALVGEWGSLGWSHAYKTSYQSSLVGDFMGATGLYRAPNTMFQSEYEATASQMFGVRMGSIPGYMIAPGFLRRSDRMAEALNAASPRLMRYGDAQAGPLGYGMSTLASHHMGRELQLQAATDLYQSGRDYNTIMSSGLEGGQFDFARTMGEIKNVFSELREATTGLTRTMKMSTEEVGQTLGALRQFGVRDVGDQYRVAQQISASARVGGLSAADMMTSSRAAIESGLGFGLYAGSSAVLGASNMAMAREMSRSGMVSTAVMAAGGGAQNLSQALTNAIQGFAGSDIGYLAMRGASGGDFMGSLAAGLGGVSSLSGLLGARAGRIDFMAGRGAGMEDATARKYLRQLVTMAGGDMDTEDGENLAFEFARSQFGLSDPAALAMARSEGRGGRASRRRQRFLESQAGIDAENNLAYDKYYTNTSMTGMVQAGIRDIASMGARAANAVGAFFEPGASGYFGFGGSYAAASKQLQFGLGLGGIQASDFAAITGDGMLGGGRRSLYMANASHWAGGLAAGGGMLGAAAGGAMLGGKLGMFGGPLGMAIGGVVGGAVGLGVGALMDTGGAASAISDPNAFLAAREGLNNSVFANMGSTALTSGLASVGINTALADDAGFQALVASANRGVIKGAAARVFHDQAAAVANRLNIGGGNRDTAVATIAAAVKAAGVNVELPDAYEAFNAGSPADLASTVAEPGFWQRWGGGYSGLSGEGGTILASAAGKSALMRMAGGMNTTYGEVIRAKAELTTLGLSSEDQAALEGNLGRLSSTERQALADARAGFSTDIGSARLRRGLRSSLSMLKGYAAEYAPGTAESFDAFQGDPASLIKALASGALSAEQSAVIKDAYGFDASAFAKDGGLLGQSAEGIVSKYFGGNKAFTSAIEEIRKGAGGNEAYFKARLGAFMLTSPAQDSNDPAKAERQSAENILNAANILKELVKKVVETPQEPKK